MAPGITSVGLRFVVLFCVASFATAVMAAEGASSGPQPYPKDLLLKVRLAATMVPGDMAVAINFAKVAESHRKYSAIIEGGNDELFVSARTAFQIRYPHGSVMLDSGMDEEVHRYYGFGRDEPYWQDVNDDVQAALRSARLIVVTHEHGDHVAGVIRSEYRDELVSKTILTKAQVQTLVHSPQIPQIGISTDQAHDYKVVDYELLLPVAPGMVLLKSPGHTAGHQMVYVQLADGAEYLFIGDIGWSLDNINELRLRPAATITRIKEDPQALMQQMTWIKSVMDEDGLIIVPSHDNRLLERYAEDGLIGTSLQLGD
jgi:glyoxylase-like metal-dependent hydrolase (beta-lactamase superfamily II)